VLWRSGSRCDKVLMFRSPLNRFGGASNSLGDVNFAKRDIRRADEFGGKG